MTCILEMAPFEGGWSVKLCETGEVLFFETRGQAQREVRRLTALHSGDARVRMPDLRGGLTEDWARPRLAPGSAKAGSLAYPLGAPA